MEDNERLKYEKTIWLLNNDLANWRKSYNVDTILSMREEIKQLKEQLKKEKMAKSELEFVYAARRTFMFYLMRLSPRFVASRFPNYPLIRYTIDGEKYTMSFNDSGIKLK